MALVYYYFDPKGQSEDSHRATLIATTLVVVMFSITVFGAVTKPLLDFTLGMGVGGKGAAASLANAVTYPTAEDAAHAMSDLSDHQQHTAISWL